MKQQEGSESHDQDVFQRYHRCWCHRPRRQIRPRLQHPRCRQANWQKWIPRVRLYSRATVRLSKTNCWIVFLVNICITMYIYINICYIHEYSVYSIYHVFTIETLLGVMANLERHWHTPKCWFGVGSVILTPNTTPKKPSWIKDLESRIVALDLLHLDPPCHFLVTRCYRNQAISPVHHSVHPSSKAAIHPTFPTVSLYISVKLHANYISLR